MILFPCGNLLGQGYCIPEPDSGAIYISNVTLNGWQNSSGNEGYTTYFNDTLDVLPGDSLPMSVTTQGSTMSMLDDVYAFFDWNRDSVFATSEASFFPVFFRVPDSIAPGPVHVRIVAAYHDDQHATPVPCLTDRGEAEDYLLNVEDTTSTIMGLSGVSPDDVKLYPNPAGDKFTLEVPQGSRVSVVNAQGCPLDDRILPTGRHTWNSSDWPVGVYTIRVQTESGRWQSKSLVVRL